MKNLVVMILLLSLGVGVGNAQEEACVIEGETSINKKYESIIRNADDPELAELDLMSELAELDKECAAKFQPKYEQPSTQILPSDLGRNSYECIQLRANVRRCESRRIDDTRRGAPPRGCPQVTYRCR